MRLPAASTPQAHARGLQLITDPVHDHETVLADRERIEHVFDNLITNAIQHTSAGGTIHLSATVDGDRARFEIADTGEGIPPEHLPRIFDKFYRVPSTRHSGGVGLGLAIVREIVTAHGGEIEVASEPGRGTKFTFTLPTGEAGLARPSKAASNGPTQLHLDR